MNRPPPISTRFAALLPYSTVTRAGHRQWRVDHLDACGLFDDMKRVGKRGRASFDQPDRSAFGTSRASAARLSGAASLAAANTATSGSTRTAPASPIAKIGRAPWRERECQSV